MFGFGQALILPFCSDLLRSPGHSTSWSTHCYIESCRSRALDCSSFSPPESGSDCQGSPESFCNFGWPQELLNSIEDMSADIYPETADAYKGPTRFAVTCPDTGDDLDYSQWIHTGAALDYHETHQQGPTSVGHGPYSNPSGLPSYQGHRNWSLPGDTWNQAINEEDCVLSSSEPAMEFSGFSDAGSYAEINDVSSTITGLIPDTRAHYQGNMSHSIDVQPVPSRTAGFVSNDMDFGSTSVHYGYKDHHRQDPHLPYQDQVQQDFQDLVPGFYPQVLYPQGQIHGRPEGATQPQDEPRTTYNVLPSRVDDMASIRANASALGSRVTASSRAYRSNTGPRLIPIPSDRAESSTRGRSSSQKASSYKELQMMPPLAPRDEGRRRDSVQTNHSSSSKYESGQRTDPLYRAYPHAVDKLYHCPFRIRGQCKHEPATLKCNYEYVK